MWLLLKEEELADSHNSAGNRASELPDIPK